MSKHNVLPKKYQEDFLTVSTPGPKRRADIREQFRIATKKGLYAYAVKPINWREIEAEDEIEKEKAQAGDVVRTIIILPFILMFLGEMAVKIYNFF